MKQFELITSDVRRTKVKKVPAKRLTAAQRGGMGLHQFQIAWGLMKHPKWILEKMES